jgi:toxin ParE1/3/4
MAGRGNAREARLRPRALADIADCATYLELSAGSQIADRFLDGVMASLDRLRSMPAIGSPRVLPHGRLRGLRQWQIKGFEDYLIFYLPRDWGVEVIRVLHAARNRDRILGSG